MGIYEIVNELKILAINTATVNMSSYGDIQLYNNKSTIKYPYVNFDIVNTSVRGNSMFYNFRIYVNDRNDPYIAYNKTELILNNILKYYGIDASTYTINFFTLNFKDLVNGCWADFIVERPLIYNCLDFNSGLTLTDDNGVYSYINSLVDFASGVYTVGESAYGEISLYDNRSNVIYPYVNFDVVSSRIVNNSNEYTIRIYVMDRNEPYTAYNKTELILNNILKKHELDISSYTINYFTLNYKDLINGCYADFIMISDLKYECLIKELNVNYIITEDGDYIITEDEDFIITED